MPQDLWPEKDRFAQAIISRYTELGGQGHLTYKRDPYEIVYPDGTFFLSNTFDEYVQSDPSKKESMIDVVVGLILKKNGPEMTREEKIACLLPCVRERFFFEAMDLQFRISGPNLAKVPRRPVCEHYVVHLVIDLPTSMAHVMENHLDELDLEFGEAMEIAIENLTRITPTSLYQEAPGLYIGPWEDCHAPARLLFTEFFDGLPLKGRPVAVAVNRNRVIITGSDDADNHPRFLELIYKALEEPRPMSPHILILKNGLWNKWELVNDSPSFNELTKLQIGASGNDYGEQKKLLEEVYEKEGKDIFVASYGSMIDKITTRERTFCVWSKDVVALLPKSDLIVFYDADRPEGKNVVCEAEWATVFDHIGKAMKPQGMFPERYLVESFPSVSLLQELDIRS